MAFSMFVRSSACANRLFSQQVMRMATQRTLSQSRSQVAPLRCLALREAKTTTPILNSVRSFRTSVVRMSAEKAHDHSKLWVIEKLTSALLVPLVPLALMAPNKVFDCALAVLITAHSFWGLEAIAVDYVRAAIFGPVIPKIAIGLVYAISIATLGGLLYIIGHDIGIANSIRRFWAIRSEQKA